MVAVRKTALITGCSAGGVGAAIAEVFQEHGYHVFATARTPSKVPQTLHAASNVTVMSLDVMSVDSIAAAAEQVAKQAGKLDVLINNAGLGLNAPVLDTPLKEAKQLFDLNFFGPMAMLQSFGPLLIKAKGCVVNISSVGGAINFPFSSIYNASKAALIQGSETWRLELAPLGVRTITLMTGGIATSFFSNMRTLPIPESSNYYGIKSIIEENPDQNPYGMEPKAFATQLLRHVERGASGKIWLGGGVAMARMLLWLSPSSAVVSIHIRHRISSTEDWLTVNIGWIGRKTEAILQSIG
ncbi:uncharacterized protein B0I36DRAFT_257953 [Microdochium trichocladiopsis]|uniref:Short-chain dehydrogenase/reductase n=1 Tax=Microdochium trichocladiopsis TaxID=1682393 RepID=A0A9P9BHU0_9PEZI|nr:uncharacterized protein B0I36DRAFT_257953 [Microdochium trichocladiopsis]KAH7009222.1 hypothetical protein B0I36DRAFT_257953 [Microdochium trichocladiopsis]